MSESKVPLSKHLLSTYPYSQGGGLLGQKDNQHNSSPRDSVNSTSQTVKALTIRGSHKASFLTYNILTLITLNKNLMCLTKNWKWSSPLRSFLLIIPVRDFDPIPIDIGKSHRICEYLRCSPNAFSTLI